MRTLSPPHSICWSLEFCLLEGDLVLHVGMSKAGSTALLNVLDEHRDALKRRGVLFPSTVFSQNDHADSSRTSGHWELMKRLRSGQPIDDLHDEVEEAAPEVARASRPRASSTTRAHTILTRLKR